MATQQTANDNVQAEIDALQSYATLQTSAQEQQQLLQAAYAAARSRSRGC